MQKRVYRWLLATLILWALWGTTWGISQAAEPVAQAVISSPTEGSTLGGVVSVLGTVTVEPLDGYTVAFGLGDNPTQWIPIVGPRQAQVKQDRLAFWDTTRIPDGSYSLRLRAVYAGKPAAYHEYIVHGLLISNAPETPTPEGTPVPSPTATTLPSPTATTEPLPTPALDDGVSSYLYVTQMEQFDPLCPGWSQSYRVWVTNIGMITVTQVVVLDSLPSGCSPESYRVTKGTVQGAEQRITWQLGEMGPGEAQKLEMRIKVPEWLQQEGAWLTNRIEVTALEMATISQSETTLLSACPWLKKTAEAKPFVMPTSKPSATPTKENETPTASGRPTLRPTATRVDIAITPQDVEKSLDLLTVIIAVVLVALLLLTLLLLYRRVLKK
jgi:uncharacterized repeat protein (TIGR01451 family)